jgi:hypothetical protein
MEEKQSLIETLAGQTEGTPTEVCQIIADYALAIFKKGDLIDCRDYCNAWFLAEVLEVSREEESRVLIHFVSWPKKFNRWVSLAEGRISRIYSPQTKNSLDSFQVGDIVDFFSDCNVLMNA